MYVRYVNSNDNSSNNQGRQPSSTNGYFLLFHAAVGSADPTCRALTPTSIPPTHPTNTTQLHQAIYPENPSSRPLV